MQQWYICPRCNRYVQFGQPHCYYCGYQMYWQAPKSSFMGKLKSIFEIIAQKTPPVQYPIPVQPPPYQPPVYPQAPEPARENSTEQPPAPAQAPSFTQPPGPAQPPAYPQAPEPARENSTEQPPAPAQAPSFTQPPGPAQPPVYPQAPEPARENSTEQPPAPAPMDKLKSIIGIPFQTSQTGQRKQQLTPPQDIASNTSQGRRNLKDALTAYLYWICLGSHYSYLDNMRTQVIFWCTLGGIGIWWLIDLVRIPGMVSDYNINQSLNAILKAEVLNKQMPSKDIQKHERNYQVANTDQFKPQD